MAPRRNKKRNDVASTATSKRDDSSKKALKKKGVKDSVGAEAASDEVASDKKPLEDEKVGDAKESAPTPEVKKKKPCTWLKLDRLNPQTESKSSPQSSKQNKEAKSTSPVQDIKDNKRKRKEKDEEKGNHDANFNKKHNDAHVGRREKRYLNDTKEDKKRREEEDEAGKRLGGLIFMCNAKTKPDCLNYKLMGVPANKKEVVLNIKPGLKLFLYDYDLKLLYGVYKASSAGGMKLEPAAFGGGFPAQVRFSVHKDCLPLPENIFKKAIIDSYDERTRKFKTELTVNQVKHLISLFRPTPWLGPNTKPMVHEVNPHHYTGNNYGITSTVPQDPFFLTEQQYRNNGLRQGGHLTHPSDPNNLDRELKHLLKDPTPSADSSLHQQQINKKTDPFFLSEEQYRTYGLRGGPQQTLNTTSAAAPRMMIGTNEIVRDSGNYTSSHYDESTTSLVNRYLALPMHTAAASTELYHPLTGRSPYTNDLNHGLEMKGRTPDGGRAFASSYTMGELSDFSQRPYSLSGAQESLEFNQGYRLQREDDSTSAPVSLRYSFAGPSLSQPR